MIWFSKFLIFFITPWIGTRTPTEKNVSKWLLKYFFRENDFTEKYSIITMHIIKKLPHDIQNDNPFD